MPPAVMDQILRNSAWLLWASSLPNASEAELAVAHGPDTHCEVFHRMHYQAVDIMTETSEYASKKAIDSLVLTWFSDGAGSGLTSCLLDLCDIGMCVFALRYGWQ